eukprot:scaffold5535_cov180-Amphora_coffeaeformis.AAC.10
MIRGGATRTKRSITPKQSEKEVSLVVVGVMLFVYMAVFFSFAEQEKSFPRFIPHPARPRCDMTNKV